MGDDCPLLVETARMLCSDHRAVDQCAVPQRTDRTSRGFRAPDANQYISKQGIITVQ